MLEQRAAVATHVLDHSATDPRTLSTRDVITKLIAPHHHYLHRTMPFVQGLARKVARVHGDREPSLRDVSTLVDIFVAMMDMHLAEEEGELFPALIDGPAITAVSMLQDMRREHEEVGEILALLRKAAADFVPPQWACTSYRTLMKELEVMEADTLEHVHLENHVLLPRYS